MKDTHKTPKELKVTEAPPGWGKPSEPNVGVKDITRKTAPKAPSAMLFDPKTAHDIAASLADEVEKNVTGGLKFSKGAREALVASLLENHVFLAVAREDPYVRRTFAIWAANDFVMSGGVDISAQIVQAVRHTQFPAGLWDEAVNYALYMAGQEMQKTAMVSRERLVEDVFARLWGNYSSNADNTENEMHKFINAFDAQGKMQPAHMTEEEAKRYNMINSLIDSISGMMRGDAQTSFSGNFAVNRFGHVLSVVPYKTLCRFFENASDELSWANYYRSLHVSIFEHVKGRGGPASVIEQVIKNSDIPEEMQFEAIVVTLRNHYETIVEETRASRKSEEELRRMAVDVGKIQGIIDTKVKDAVTFQREREAVDVGLKLRAEVADEIKDREIRKEFLRSPSLQCFMRKLHKLDLKVANELAGKELIGKYAPAHAKMMDNGWLGVPADLIVEIHEKVPEKLQALAITAVVKELANEGWEKVPKDVVALQPDARRDKVREAGYKMIRAWADDIEKKGEAETEALLRKSIFG